MRHRFQHVNVTKAVVNTWKLTFNNNGLDSFNQSHSKGVTPDGRELVFNSFDNVCKKRQKANMPVYPYKNRLFDCKDLNQIEVLVFWLVLPGPVF